MAMIGVPLMSKGINPYKQQSTKLKNDNNPKVPPTRRRYHSEYIAQPMPVTTRKRYQSVNHSDKENKGPHNIDESKRTWSSPNVGPVNNRKTSLDLIVRKNSAGAKSLGSSPVHPVLESDPRSMPTKSPIRKPSYLHTISEEKYPSLTNLQDIIEDNYKTIRSTTSRRRSLSENAVEYLKTPEKKGRWKRWNPINMWHHLRGTTATNNKVKETIKNSISTSSSSQSVPSSCNCIT